MSFYTYAHYKPDGSLFYIGKGSGMRYKNSTSGRSKHWHAMVAEAGGFNAKILAHWTSETDALEHESFLISCFKDMGTHLANRTTGGQKGRHYPITEINRKNIILGQKQINDRRLVDSDWDKKIHNARSLATKNRIEGYQKEAGAKFSIKFKTNTKFANGISENRKKAKEAGKFSLYAKDENRVRLVRIMRINGSKYLEISKKTGFFISVISGILNGKQYVGVGEISHA